MKIGILITSVSNFGEKGFYNAQEIGLAKAISKMCEKVLVYKLVPLSHAGSDEILPGYRNVRVQLIPSKNSGINGVPDVNVLDEKMDMLLHFSDTQFSVPKVYKWASQNKVKYVPYIGVIESHSTSAMKRAITNLKFRQNLQIYKKCECLAKTPQVMNELKHLGVKEIKVASVGLDMALMRTDYDSFDKEKIKKKYGYGSKDRILLFIGRLIDEKQPVKMIDLFEKIVHKEENYKLLMVGSGELKSKVIEQIRKYNLEDRVQLIEKIPNNQIWELYAISDCFVNLNQQEIFGMAILEAMYYGCKVVAWNAPGPNYIIENGSSGWLVSENEELEKKILDKKDFSKTAHQRILDKFTWENTARTVMSTVEKRK